MHLLAPKQVYMLRKQAFCNAPNNSEIRFRKATLLLIVIVTRLEDSQDWGQEWG